MKNILSLCDAYKISHKAQYPEGTTMVYSNWTIRKSRIPNVDHYVFFGLQYFIKEYLIKRFNEEFFYLPKEQALAPFKRRINAYLGETDLSHFEKLHDLGYLPIQINALPEGSLIPVRIPCFTIWNTHPDFYWVTNYLETIMSTTIWGGINSATIAHQFAKIRDKYMELTGSNPAMRDWLLHDFSYRGMFGNEAAMISGSAFLLSSCGTDCIPAIDFLEEYYDADATSEVVAGSVPATEHSVQCAGTQESELETYRRLLTKVYPTGIISIVSDTWDYWNVLTVILPELRETILARNGKLVIRPDSSPKTPLEIICGDPDAYPTSPEWYGSLRLLYEIFGGSTNDKGFIVLDSHIGLIYGEAISIELYEKICAKMMEMGFDISNLVVGIGSYSMTYHTRDTLGQAIKATYCEINGNKVPIFKAPKTDDGTKYSAKGLIAVYDHGNGDITMDDNVSWSEVHNCDMEPVFKDGKQLYFQSLSDIRQRLNSKPLVQAD